MAMSKTVAAGFQSRFAHFITVGRDAREAGEFRAEDQGREGTVGGAKGTEDGGREWRGRNLSAKHDLDSLAFSEGRGC